MLSEFLQFVIAPWKDFALDWVSRCSADGEGEYALSTGSTADLISRATVDWLPFSEVFKALVKLMNALSVHFTTCLESAPGNTA
jgi:hypothetical protein